MTTVVKFYIVLFAIMFFWVYSVEAFAQYSMTCSPPSSAGVITCYTSDGKIVVVNK